MNKKRLYMLESLKYLGFHNENAVIFTENILGDLSDDELKNLKEEDMITMVFQEIESTMNLFLEKSSEDFKGDKL